MARTIQSLVPTVYGTGLVNSATITLATAAAAVKKLVVEIDGVAAEHELAELETAENAGIALDAAIDVALAAAGVDAEYTVTNALGVVTVVLDEDGDGNTRLLAVQGVSEDTGGMTLVVASQQQSWRMLSNGVTKLAGQPVNGNDGFDIQLLTDEHKAAQGQGVSLVFRTRLNNGTVSVAKTARWQVWAHSPVWGWSQNLAVGTRSFTSEAESGFTFDEVAVQLFGKDRVAVVLLDDGADGDLAGQGVSLDAWGSEG